MPRRKAKNDRQDIALFKKLYFTPDKASSFGGKERFLKTLKNKYGASNKLLIKAKNWLQGVDTYTRHKIVFS